LGPFTRAIRTIFAALFGALAGFVVSLIVDAVLHDSVASVARQRPQAPQLAVLATVGLMVLGAAIGAFVGAGRRKRKYHDES